MINRFSNFVAPLALVSALSCNNSKEITANLEPSVEECMAALDSCPKFNGEPIAGDADIRGRLFRCYDNNSDGRVDLVIVNTNEIIANMHITHSKIFDSENCESTFGLDQCIARPTVNTGSDQDQLDNVCPH